MESSQNETSNGVGIVGGLEIGLNLFQYDFIQKRRQKHLQNSAHLLFGYDDNIPKI